MTSTYQKKIKLGVHERRTKWAPIWVSLKKFGMGQGKRRHVSEITKVRRNWRRNKLKIKPRKAVKRLG